MPSAAFLKRQRAAARKRRPNASVKGDIRTLLGKLSKLLDFDDEDDKGSKPPSVWDDDNKPKPPLNRDKPSRPPSVWDDDKKPQPSDTPSG